MFSAQRKLFGTRIARAGNVCQFAELHPLDTTCSLGNLRSRLLTEKDLTVREDCIGKDMLTLLISKWTSYGS